LLLGGASTIMMWRFQKVLDLYLQASEGLINHNKCHIYAWNVNKTLVNAISSVFQFPHNESWTSFKYGLGMPICLWSSSFHLWQHVINKINTKFTLYGAQWLNHVGYLVLIKFVLLALHVFQYSTLLAPMGIQLQIAQDIRRFHWQGGKQTVSNIIWSIGLR
jgi:hypothetical protein